MATDYDVGNGTFNRGGGTEISNRPPIYRVTDSQMIINWRLGLHFTYSTILNKKVVSDRDAVGKM